MTRAQEHRDNHGAFYGIQFHCPGCNYPHIIPTKNGLRGEAGWDWNGSLETPTLHPSVLVHRVLGEGGVTYRPRCHSIVTDGKIEFLGDSGHALAGRTVELPTVP